MYLRMVGPRRIGVLFPPDDNRSPTTLIDPENMVQMWRGRRNNRPGGPAFLRTFPAPQRRGVVGSAPFSPVPKKRKNSLASGDRTMVVSPRPSAWR